MSDSALLWTAVPVLVVGVALMVVGWVRRRQALVLTATVCTAIGVLAGVSGWILAADEKAGVGDALRTGGLGAAAVVALYGLWLNDRRRRVEENRQQTESDRHQLESGRVADERFARAVEMLGSDADQVRVGAMHALAGLARDTPRYTQTVLDVLCAYLRRPFTHPAYKNAHDPDRSEEPSDAAQDQERQVRLTAQRLISRLLPAAGDDGPAYDLDLSGATVEYFPLAGKKTGRITARRARFYGITRFAGLEATGDVKFSGATFFGRAEFNGARFNGVAFTAVRFARVVDLAGAAFHDWVELGFEQPADLILDGTVIHAEKVKLPAGLAVTADGELQSAVNGS